MADNIGPLAWMADPNGNFFFYNQRWYEYTGTTFDQMQGWGWQTVHHPDHLSRVLEKWRANLQTGQPWEDTFPLRGRDGRFRWFLSRAFPLRDAQGVITRWFGTNADINELLESKDALARAKSEIQQQADTLQKTVAERTTQLREANENLQTFAYTAAHDLRAPLRSIRGFCSVAVDELGTTDHPEISTYLQRVLRSADHMERLLADLLEHARISQAELRLESVNLQSAVTDALALIETDIHAKNASITVAQALPCVLAHRATVTLLIQNLVSNALKFVPPGTQPEVRISAEVLAGHNGHGASALSLNSTPTHFVRFSVQDNGIGIAQPHIGKLFDVFQRVHGGEYQGTGLGLAIVRKGAERMGGRVGFESEPGKGSKFWLELKKK